ncbi:response regulator [Massilia niabensis]|uniref:Response regulator n=1 Tax=Massilia niabensis TaxID=544910 RepID=A0ABW0L247_9BURK
MLPSSKSALTTSTYDWSTSALGDPAGWPQPLRLAADLMFNMPLPMLLQWGPARPGGQPGVQPGEQRGAQAVVLCNEAYGQLAGPGFARVPGGSAPAVLPPPIAAAGEAVARAWRGEAACVPAAAVHFGGGSQERYDLHLTPIPFEGAVGGVLYALAPASASAPQDTFEPGTLSILVVEDNLDSQYLVCEMLKAFGYEADGVAHPEDALAHLAANRYHILFTDVSLPGMSGVDLARQAISTYPHLKVIFASGYGDTLLRHLDFPYQSLQKPYELDQLQHALGQAADQLRVQA